MDGVLALSWFEHRRTRGLCAGLGIELALVATHHHGVWRYLLLGRRTLVLLFKRRPKVLLVQSPSLVLSILALILRPLLKYRLVVDAHNEAVVPHEHPQPWIRWLSNWVIREAELTIVTNRQMAEDVRHQRGRAFILPDRIPEPPMGVTRRLAAEFSLVLIATFAKDEPIGAIFEAVRDMKIALFVTGNPRKIPSELLARKPGNVHFTGFLPDQEYWDLLRSADGIIDLTLKQDCLVCGAYEALAVGKPMLLSNNAATAELFGSAAVLTDNSPRDIRVGLGRLQSEHAQLLDTADRARSVLREKWALDARTLTEVLRAPDAT